ncbi:MAG: c-type cytochrome [Planctomycetaceae bacterium]
MRRFLRIWLSISCVLLSWNSSLPAQRLEMPRRHDRPPGEPLTAEQAVAKMTVPEGFSVEIVAAEPDVVNPVAMFIDEQGRYWITESFEYPRREPGPGRDRIKVLEDTDGDGRVDKTTVFAEGLNIPSGIAVGYGGVWVANAPDILFLQDTDGDLKADRQEVIVTGFGRTDTHELPNAFTWGPDGWLYGLNGVFNYCDVKYAESNPNYKAEHPGWKFTCAMWRIHPRTKEFQIFAEGTSNPWGIAINGEGDFFISACVIDHLWHIQETGYYIRQGGPYPPHTWPMRSIVDHHHQKAAYCGITWFDSPAYPEEYRNVLYMGNIHGGCINADIAERSGSTYKGRPHPGFPPQPGAWDKDEYGLIAKTGDEQSPKLADFLTANDAWFMPVVQTVGPDGCLYVLDWYDRYHCYQDANADPEGIERSKGRLYRVVYKDHVHRKPENLAAKSDDELIALLGDANVYNRQTAQRLLVERAHPETLAKLDAILFKQVDSNDGDQWSRQDIPLTTRLHALWTRTSITEPDDEFMQKLARSYREPLYVAWYYRIAGDSWRDLGPEEWFRKLKSFEVWDASGKLARDNYIAACGKRATAAQRIHNCWMTTHDDTPGQQLVWENMKEALVQAPEAWVSFLDREEDAEVVLTNRFEQMIPRSLEVLVAAPSVDGRHLGAVLALVIDSNAISVSVKEQCFSVVSNALRQKAVSADRAATMQRTMAEALAGFDRMEKFLVEDQQQPHSDLYVPVTIFRSLAGDAAASRQLSAIYYDRTIPLNRRIEALQSLIAAGDNRTVLNAVSDTINDPSGNAEFRIRVIEQLGAVQDADTGTELAKLIVDNLPRWEAEVRPKAIEVLTQRPVFTEPLLRAVIAKEVDKDALNLNQLRRIATFKHDTVKQLLVEVYGEIREGRDPNREQVFYRTRDFLNGTPGDPANGAVVFKKVCGQCHKLYGEGAEVGPDITRNGRSNWDQLLWNVLDPSQVIGPGYQARLLVTADGRTLTGLPVEESEQSVTLKVQGGKVETIPRDQIEVYKVSELSMMPDQLEKQLTPQELADLFSYLAHDRDPRTRKQDCCQVRPTPGGSRR